MLCVAKLLQISLPAAAAIIRGLCIGLAAAAEGTGRSKAEVFVFLRLLLPHMHEALVDTAQALAVPQKRSRLQAIEAQSSEEGGRGRKVVGCKSWFREIWCVSNYRYLLEVVFSCVQARHPSCGPSSSSRL